MKKKILRTLSIFLALFLIIGVLPIEVTAVESSNDFTYQILEDGTVEVTRYIGEDSHVVIPEEIDGKIVTKVNEFCFYNDSDYNGANYLVTSIFISKYVNVFSDPSYGEGFCLNRIVNLEELIVDEENSTYASNSGILFSKDLSNLIHYPKAKLGDEYTVPSHVKELSKSAFSMLKYLKRIKFVAPLDSVESPAIFGGVLEEADFPVYKKNDGENHVFSFCENLNKVFISKEVKMIDDYEFKGAQNTVLYVYPDSYALEWAQNHDFEYVIIEYLKGDVDNDGEITIKDATSIQSYIAKFVIDAEFNKDIADIDNDSEVTIKDATNVQMIVAKLV